MKIELIDQEITRFRYPEAASAPPQDYFAIDAPLQPRAMGAALHQDREPMVLHRSSGLRIWGSDEIAFQTDPDFSPIEDEIEIPILTLHCPKHAGCSVTETFATERGSESSISVAFAGLGGGGTLIASLKVEEEWTTQDGQCLEVVIPARVRLEYGVYTENGNPFSTAFRVSVKDLAGGSRVQRELSGVRDLCSTLKAGDPRFQSVWGRASVDAGSMSYTTTASQTLKGSAELDLKFFDQKLGIKAGYTRSSTFETKRSASLAPGATYEAFVGKPATSATDAAEIVWLTLEK